MKDGLKFVGWLNFIISIIGSIILFANSKIEYESYLGISRSKVDPTIIVTGLAILVTGLTIIVICYGIAKVIENQEIKTVNRIIPREDIEQTKELKNRLHSKKKYVFIFIAIILLVITVLTITMTN